MNSKNEGGPDPLEKIFLLVGRRKPVDPERAEVIEQKTRERWQNMLAHRRVARKRRTLKILGGGIAVAASFVAAGIFMTRLTTEIPAVATVVKVLGMPETGSRGQAMTALHEGTLLRAGSVLETSQEDGISLHLTSGHKLRLASASRIRIELDAVVLDSGAVYIDSGGDGRATRFEVRSRVATLRELGTQYMAILIDDSLEVSVREGAVRVSQGNHVETAFAGEIWQLDATGRTQKSNIPEYGDHWAWITALASVPDLEEMSLSEFLHWVAREQGWQLEFATSELAHIAAAVELHGSIQGLTHEDALAVVMTSTGWRYTLEDGALTIESRGEAR